MTTDVREDDLHAYVDGKLPEPWRTEVEAWLASHPEDALRVQDWAEQNRALHAAFDDVLNEPLPLDLVRTARQRKPSWPARAAAVLAFTAVGLAGYGIGRYAAPDAAAPVYLARDAAMAHVVFSPEVKHPVEVDSTQAEHLVAWLSKRLGAPLKAPDFSARGFALLGGRLLPGATGPVAQFMYQDRLERRVTLYVRRDAEGGRDTAFRHARENGVDVFYWIDRDFGYALSGQIGRQDIGALADSAYRQMLAPVHQ